MYLSTGRTKFDVRLVEAARVVASEQTQRANDFAAEYFDGARDAGAAGRTEPISIGPADEHRARSQAQRLHDVAPTANASVQQNLGASVNGGDDFRQRA
jgi:hypothetical protein